MNNNELKERLELLEKAGMDRRQFFEADGDDRHAYCDRYLANKGIFEQRKR